MTGESVYTDGSIEPRVNTSSIADDGDAILSIAISLKRIADVLEALRDIKVTEVNRSLGR